MLIVFWSFWSQISPLMVEKTDQETKSLKRLAISINTIARSHARAIAQSFARFVAWAFGDKYKYNCTIARVTKSRELSDFLDLENRLTDFNQIFHVWAVNFTAYKSIVYLKIGRVVFKIINKKEFARFCRAISINPALKLPRSYILQEYFREN